MQPTIKKALSNDAKSLSEISFSSKKFWGYPAEWMEKWKEGLTISESYIQENEVFKLLLADQIIGFAAVEIKSDFFQLEHLWILPKHIGNGFGNLLLQEVLQIVIPIGAKVKVLSDPNAEAFYKKQGFKTIDAIESEPKGRFLPLMELDFQKGNNA